ncbi:MAG: hypothetical protein IJA86_02310 [Clostridia bacterium]|nr:hypothetical protein [Clostridia bacterium]
MKKIKSFLKTLLRFISNPRLLLCFFIAWMITNGWSYVMFAVGTLYRIEWMIAVSSAYLAFLWLPISPEKIVTVFIAMALLKWLFPSDEKTLGVLKSLHEKYKKKKSESDDCKLESSDENSNRE